MGEPALFSKSAGTVIPEVETDTPNPTTSSTPLRTIACAQTLRHCFGNHRHR
jgi:hypothetical protein